MRDIYTTREIYSCPGRVTYRWELTACSFILIAMCSESNDRPGTAQEMLCCCGLLRFVL
jgi:hypothetical protein